MANNSEQLAQILRDISNRRKSGILEARLSNEVCLNFLFQQGKLFDCYPAGQRSIDATLQYLKGKELVAAQAACSKIEELIGLMRAPLPGMIVDQNLLRLILKQRLLEMITQIWEAPSLQCTFQSGMVSAEREFMPQISGSQILLDLADLEQTQLSFMADIGDNVLIAVADSSLDELGVEELLVQNLCQDRQSFASLLARGILCRLASMQALLQLKARGLVLLEPIDLSDLGATRSEQAAQDAIEAKANAQPKSLLQPAKPSVQADQLPVRSVSQVAYLIGRAFLQPKVVRVADARTGINVVLWVFLVLGLLKPFYTWRSFILLMSGQ